MAKRPILELCGGVTRFGRLTLIDEGPSLARSGPGGDIRIGNFRCDCGNRIAVRVDNVKRHRTTSCGCANLDAVQRNIATHGDCRVGGVAPEYRTWSGMIQRCTNPLNKNFVHYGGRGIAICKRWAADYEAFLNDMGRRPSLGHSLDRINVNGSYEPENCRWATAKEQGRNQRRNRIISVNGERFCIAEAAERFGLKQETITARLNAGKSAEAAVIPPK